jgi:hypothetical protein
MSITEPSYAVKRRNDKQTGVSRLALRASIRPPVSILAWLGLAFLGLDSESFSIRHVSKQKQIGSLFLHKGTPAIPLSANMHKFPCYQPVKTNK